MAERCQYCSGFSNPMGAKCEACRRRALSARVVLADAVAPITRTMLVERFPERFQRVVRGN